MEIKRIYVESQTSKANPGHIYLVVAYAIDTLDRPWGMPPILMLGTLEGEQFTEQRWSLLNELVFSRDCAIQRKAIELFDHYVQEAEIRCVSEHKES